MDTSSNPVIPGKSKSPEQIISSGLYEMAFPLVKNLCLHNSGTIEDAKDIFHDGLLVLMKKLKNDEPKLICKQTTYLYRTCKNIWSNELKKRRIRKEYYTTIITGGGTEEILTPDDRIEERKRELFQKHFSKLKSSQKEILDLYFDGNSTADIMECTGLSTIHYAKKKIYKCKTRLFNKIIRDPEYLRLRDI